jgi:hypothetical protein
MFIQEQAEHFFNAFEVLRESNELLIDNLANSSATPQAGKKFGLCPTMGVEIVCLAFSVELYIKGLHYAITNEAPRGHNILALFKKLPEKIQQEVFSFRSISEYGWSFPEFEKQIEAISDSFEKWRYAYEVTTIRYNSYFALVFIEAIKSATASERSRSTEPEN